MKDTPSKSAGAGKKKAPVTTAKKAPAATAKKAPAATAKKVPAATAKKVPTTTKTSAAKRTASKKEPTYEEISMKAHEVFLERTAKGEPGDSDSDWHRAVEILKGK